MAAATTAAVVGIAVGVNALSGGAITDAFTGGGGAAERARQQQQLADPFSSHRGKLGDMYSDYLTGKTPTDPNQMPGYSSFESGVLNPAMEATKRSMAASGQMQSGNEQIALQKVGQQGYYGFMTDYLNRLATGSGATYGPATAAGQGYEAGRDYDQQMMQALGGTVRSAADLYRSSKKTANSSYGMPSWGSYGGTTSMGGSADANSIFGSSGYGDYQQTGPIPMSGYEVNYFDGSYQGH